MNKFELVFFIWLVVLSIDCVRLRHKLSGLSAQQSQQTDILHAALKINRELIEAIK